VVYQTYCYQYGGVYQYGYLVNPEPAVFIPMAYDSTINGNNEFQLNFISGPVQFSQAYFAPTNMTFQDPTYLAPDGAYISNSESSSWIMLYLCSVFQSLYCADFGFNPTPPLAVQGYNEITLDFSGGGTVA
jgi:hypothetical protein